MDHTYASAYVAAKSIMTTSTARSRRTARIRIRKLVPSRRCTVLPLTSTDVAGEVVMSSMSCVLLFSAVVYLSLASLSLSLFLFFNICLRSRVQPGSPFPRLALVHLPPFVSLCRKDDLPREDGHWIATWSSDPACRSAFIFAYVASDKERRLCSSLHRASRSAFLILAYRKSHGA